MKTALGPTLTARFHRFGIAYPIPVLTTDEVRATRAGLDALLTENGPCLSIGWSHLFFPWSNALIRHPRVLEAVTELLGPDLLVQGTLILTKPAGHPGRLCWHQDGLHTDYDPEQAVTAWLALTPSTRASGCMRVVPGTHGGRLPHHEISEPDEMARNAARVDLAIDPGRVDDIELEPGEMSLHHPFLVHGSGPNSADHPRIGFIVRYGTPATRVSDPVVRVRGGGDYSHLCVAERPIVKSLSEMVATWRAFERDRVLPGAPR